ncbi:MAG: type restriction-modification system methyltransferase subunit [Flaviaesturariibacter sp.]|nr:type restriction-modification system methyltransferase subunit [Flaviaesturariibacter sp.]
MEIARLSLWLRTARPERKLSNLSSNIKCGNSLIDDPAVAGAKAFKWEEEYKEVFNKGGFDIVIGNPPYLRVQGLRENFEKETKYYEHQFDSATGRFDIYVLFMEQSYRLINDTGLISFILPHKFMISDFGEGIRKFLVDKKAVKSIVSFGAEMVFADASTYTCVINLNKANEYVYFKEVKPKSQFDDISFQRVSYDQLSSAKWNLQGEEGNNLFEKLNKQPLKAKDVFEYISQGVVSVGDDIFIMKGEFINDKFIGWSERLKQQIEVEASLMKPLLKGDEIKKYAPLQIAYYTIYPHIEIGNKTIPLDEVDFRNQYPLGYAYMLQFKEELSDKKIRYKTNPKHWYSLHRAREIKMFEQEKIITPETSFGTNMTIDSKNLYHNTQGYSLIRKEKRSEDYKFLLCLLNSSLMWYYLKNTGTVLRGGFFRFKTAYIETFPMPEANVTDQQPFITLADTMLATTASLQAVKQDFLHFLTGKFPALTVNKKLADWPSLAPDAFLKELSKAKLSLTLPQEREWVALFEADRQKAAALQDTLRRTDAEIDRLVYNLYGLTAAEVAVVEGG